MFFGLDQSVVVYSGLFPTPIVVWPANNQPFFVQGFLLLLLLSQFVLIKMNVNRVANASVFPLFTAERWMDG